MNKKLLAIFIGSALVLTACGGENEATDKETSTTNEETTTANVDVEKKFQQKCSMCHGVNLNDGRGDVPDLTTVGSRLSKEEIEDVILNGRGAMPGGQLQGEEASAVAEWLATKK